MRNIYLLLFALPIILNGCTKNNQGQPDDFAYLEVNQTYVLHSSSDQALQTYDIDNDGQVDWGFNYSLDIYGLATYGSNYNSFIKINSNAVKILPINYTVSSTEFYSSIGTRIHIWGELDNNIHVNPAVLGNGDFYIGFKSQNPTFTNTFYGWAKLNLSADGKTLIVKDMAINTINGGSINVGQH
ncbi:MAG TPA: hypothetical protein VK154_08885 [Chitinophagales bacterium]|nr:hypothetical protein [Chitinophagales bacterium]